MKIVINKCYGSFSISLDAAKFMAKKGNKQAIAEIAEYEKKLLNDKQAQFYGYGYSKKYNDSYLRVDKDLIMAIEELREKASRSCSKLAVIEIPDNIEWEISEYDGMEQIEEKHRSWS